MKIPFDLHLRITKLYNYLIVLKSMHLLSFIAVHVLNTMQKRYAKNIYLLLEGSENEALSHFKTHFALFKEELNFNKMITYSYQNITTFYVIKTLKISFM